MPNGKPVLLVLESHDGVLRTTSLEGFSAGRVLADELGSDLVALAVGSGISDSAGDLAGYGAVRVLVADDERLSTITVDGYVTVIDSTLDDLDPGVVILAGTTAGRDIAAYLAGKHGLAHLPDCNSLRIDAGSLIAKRPVYGNKMLTEVRAALDARVLVTLHTGAFKVPEVDGNRAAAPESVDVEFGEGDIRVKVTGLESSASGAVDLSRADVVVIGGRGLGKQENYDLVQQLAEVLGGSAGATRAVTDLGWRPHYEQVGQTGQKIAPKLYIGIGVSGAVQHTVGMVNSETIVAINRDPEAPIFKMSDFGLVGDLEVVVPKLIERLRERKGS